MGHEVLGTYCENLKTYLKGDQPEAARVLLDFVSNDEQYFRFSGAAGTGKTWIISKLVAFLIDKRPQIKIAQCAPTNKAVKVAIKTAKEHNDGKLMSNINYRTIHSLMGLREKKREGKVVYEPDVDPMINEYDFVIVDEYSMISRDMLNMILDECDVKLMFVGDQHQLPPVDEDFASVEYLDCQSFRMEQPIRQGSDNPIIDLSQIMIRRVYHPIEQWDERLVLGTGVVQLDSRVTRDEINELFLKYFTSEAFHDDSDYCKVLSFTNQVVGDYNQYIRRMYFNEDWLPKIVYGERLVVLNAIKDPNDTADFQSRRLLYHTNDEIEVVSYDVITQTICGVELTFYETTVYDYDNRNKRNVINIIHEDSETQFKQLLEALANNAKTQSDRLIRKNLWKLFFQVKESFAEVTYSYALTIHKSQGSTYNTVFFDMRSLGRYSTMNFKKRLQYTAVTRASRKLYLIY